MKITIERLAKRFGATPVIRELSLVIDSGQLLTLLGASGSGKTTLLRMIAGLERPDGGRILFDDRVVCDPAAGIFVPPRERQLGMVFQSYALWPHLDVAGNLGLALHERGLAGAAIRERVAQALRLVGLEGLAERAIHQLSGGQQQRVALARALVAEPALLLFDEPLSNLDAALREQMREEIRTLQQRLGITAVFVTHDQAEALALSDRIAVLDHGRVAQIDTPDALYLRPHSQMTARFMGQVNLLQARGEAGAVRVGSVRLELDAGGPDGRAGADDPARGGGLRRRGDADAEHAGRRDRTCRAAGPPALLPGPRGSPGQLADGLRGLGPCCTRRAGAAAPAAGAAAAAAGRESARLNPRRMAVRDFSLRPRSGAGPARRPRASAHPGSGGARR